MEFLYTKNPDAEIPIMVVDKHIGNDKEDGEGIMGGKFLDEFFELANGGKTKCEVWINSPGGKMMEAYDMVSAMKRSAMKPDTLNIGMAASCGGWLQLSGKKVRMMDYSTFMCHDPQSADGEPDDATKAMTLSVALLISEGSGRNNKPKLTIDEALNLMKQTTFLTAYECLEMGLCDEVVKSGNNAHYAEMSDKWEAGKYYLNNTVIDTKTKKMENISLVTNELDLNEDSNAKAIVKAISKMKNELDKSKKEVEDVRKEKNDMAEEMDKKNDYDDLKKSVNEMTDKCNDMEDKVKNLTEENNALKAKAVKDEENRIEAENAAKAVQLENDCKNMVNKYTNKIGTDEKAVAEWVGTAKVIGADKVEAMLKNLPLVTNATRLKTMEPKDPKDQKGEGETTADVMNKLAEQRKAAKK